MIHWLTFTEYENIRLNTAIERQVRDSSFMPKRVVTVEQVRVAEQERAKPDDGRKRQIVVCPDCHRSVPMIDGNLLSHRKILGGNGEWCLLT